MKRLIVISAVALILAGCTNTSVLSGDVYTADQAKQTQLVSYGTVLSARAVQIQANSDTPPLLGTVGGAVLGGFLGNTIGKGTAHSLAIAGGALAGTLAGQAVENKVNLVDAVELEIKQEGGSTIVIVQKDNPNKFHPGQHVKLVSDGKKINVSPR